MKDGEHNKFFLIMHKKQNTVSIANEVEPKVQNRITFSVTWNRKHCKLFYTRKHFMRKGNEVRF
jgi:hypothetical protein